MVENRVDILKEQLMRVASKFGNLTHPDVIFVSQKLDKIIVEIQRAQLDVLIQTQGYYAEYAELVASP